MELHCLTILWIFSPCFATGSLCKAPVNLALDKPSESTKHLHNNKAHYANNGNLGGRFVSEDKNINYWYTNLEAEVKVTFILIKYEMPWENLYVGVSNSAPTEDSDPEQSFNICKHFTETPDEWIQQVECGGKVGQYVILFSKTTNSSEMRLIEVEVYNTTDPPKPGYRGNQGIREINLARNKQSKMSSTEGDHTASHGNDGNPHTKALTDENATTPAFWYVDLERKYEVLRIIFYFDGEWPDLTVGISEQPPTSESKPDDDFHVCHKYDSQEIYPLKKVNCKSPGQYAILYRQSAGKFEIREFEVYTKDCCDVPWLEHASADYPQGTKQKAVATIVCDEGWMYKLDDSTSTECKANGQWEPTVECILDPEKPTDSGGAPASSFVVIILAVCLSIIIPFMVQLTDCGISRKSVASHK